MFDFILINYPYFIFGYILSVILSYISAHIIAKNDKTFFENCSIGLTIVIVFFPVLNIVFLVCPLLFNSLILKDASNHLLFAYTKENKKKKDKQKNSILILKKFTCEHCKKENMSKIDSVELTLNKKIIVISYKCEDCGLFTTKSYKIGEKEINTKGE